MNDKTKNIQAFAKNIRFMGCAYGHLHPKSAAGLREQIKETYEISSFNREIAINSIKTNLDKVGTSCVAINIESIYRGLTDGEMKMVKRMFDNKDGKSAVPYEKIRVYKNNYGYLANVPVTPDGNINWPEEGFLADFSKGTLAQQNAFIHEFSHVWQFYLKKNLYLESGAAQAHAIFLSGGRGLAYKYVLDGRLLGEFNVEQQADIIADYYCLRYMGPAHTFSDFSREFVRKNGLIEIYKKRSLPENVKKRTYENALNPYKECLHNFLQDPASLQALSKKKMII